MLPPSESSQPAESGVVDGTADAFGGIVVTDGLFDLGKDFIRSS